MAAFVQGSAKHPSLSEAGSHSSLLWTSTAGKGHRPNFPVPTHPAYYSSLERLPQLDYRNDESTCSCVVPRYVLGQKRLWPHGPRDTTRMVSYPALPLLSYHPDACRLRSPVQPPWGAAVSAVAAAASLSPFSVPFLLHMTTSPPGPAGTAPRWLQFSPRVPTLPPA